MNLIKGSTTLDQLEKQFVLGDPQASLKDAFLAIEKLFYFRSLARNDRDKVKAAGELGVCRRTVYYKLHSYTDGGRVPFIDAEATDSARKKFIEVALKHSAVGESTIALKDYTCSLCVFVTDCRSAFDAYNIEGECLEQK